MYNHKLSDEAFLMKLTNSYHQTDKEYIYSSPE